MKKETVKPKFKKTIKARLPVKSKAAFQQERLKLLSLPSPYLDIPSTKNREIPRVFCSIGNVHLCFLPPEQSKYKLS